jgi:hypothetical protein
MGSAARDRLRANGIEPACKQSRPQAYPDHFRLIPDHERQEFERAVAKLPLH